LAKFSEKIKDHYLMILKIGMVVVNQYYQSRQVFVLRHIFSQWKKELSFYGFVFLMKYS